MGYLTNVEIYFSRANRVYFSGEKVHGSLKFTITQPVKLKSINLAINGSSSCTIKKKNSNNFTQGFQPYLKANISFLAQNVPDHELDPGSYNYDFQIDLPKSLPSSFKHKNGETSYHLCAFFQKSWSIDRKITQYFTVINSCGFSHNKTSLTNHNFKKTNGMCCAKSGIIHAKLSCERYSYAIDQLIKFKIKVNNESKRELNGLEAYLVQNIVFKADKTNKAIYKRKLSTVKHPTPILSATEVEIDDKFKVPLVQPTYIDDMLEITYKLEFRVKTGAFVQDLVGNAGININCNAETDDGSHTVLFNIENLSNNPFK